MSCKCEYSQKCDFQDPAEPCVKCSELGLQCGPKELPQKTQKLRLKEAERKQLYEDLKKLADERLRRGQTIEEIKAIMDPNGNIAPVPDPPDYCKTTQYDANDPTLIWDVDVYPGWPQQAVLNHGFRGCPFLTQQGIGYHAAQNPVPNVAMDDASYYYWSAPQFGLLPYTGESTIVSDNSYGLHNVTMGISQQDIQYNGQP